MPDIAVKLPDTAYTVRIEPGLLQRAGHELRAIFKSTKVIVVTDEIVGPIHLPALKNSLQEAGFEVISATLPSGEQHKTLRSLLPVYDTLLGARIERSTPLIALGGGIVGDMAGFIAATLLRGISLVQIPTTLLAMVDASVGGKTGVNHEMGKNLIGAFHHPSLVLADPAVLTTLPRDHFTGGLAECIKHEVIRDAVGFDGLEKNIEKILSLDIDALTQLVSHNVQIKASVVQADPFEHGERAHLNFGHTFAHAIERASQHRYPHGQAVGLGMVAASHLASDLGMLDKPSRDRIIELIQRAGLPTEGARVSVESVVDAMAFDKKVAAARIRFILPDRIGHVVIRDDVSPAMLIRAVRRVATD